MSMMQDIVEADVFITSVQFSEASMELTFLENREQAEDVAIMRSMMLSLEKNPRLQQAFRDLQEMLQYVVDEGYFSLRNEGQSGTIREQMLARRAAAEAAAAEGPDETPADIEKPKPEMVVRSLI
jgi:hypothetical protein